MDRSGRSGRAKVFLRSRGCNAPRGPARGRTNAHSREKARALIMSGHALVDGQPELRASALIPVDAELATSATARFASRGGEKLDHALTRFGIDVTRAVAVDVGASTGGFTDCLLQRGAARVFAVDVGHGQLDARLRDDPRVIVMERVNARELPLLPEQPSLATIDVSFISLTVVLPAIAGALSPGADVVALVKPQFEAGKEQVDRRGVVRDPLVQAEVIGRVAWWSVNHGIRVRGVCASPLLGPAGNREFFLWLRRNG